MQDHYSITSPPTNSFGLVSEFSFAPVVPVPVTVDIGVVQTSKADTLVAIGGVMGKALAHKSIAPRLS